MRGSKASGQVLAEALAWGGSPMTAEGRVGGGMALEASADAQGGLQGRSPTEML